MMRRRDADGLSALSFERHDHTKTRHGAGVPADGGDFVRPAVALGITTVRSPVVSHNPIGIA